MPKITVLMPSLNVARYIEKCMDSVLAQTLQDLEVLAIDAGSTDGTLEILRKYEKKDKRVRVIISDVKSYGHQINLGIMLATGDYVGIVETDDEIVSDMYEVLYNVAEKKQADYVKGAAKAFWEDDILGELSVSIDAIRNITNEYENGIAEVALNKKYEMVLGDYYLWCGIYKRELIKKISLNESKGAAYQDIGFMLQAQLNASKMVYVDKMVYRYRRDNPNASCYNKQAFHYLVQEYDYVEDRVKFPDKLWKKAFYQKLFRQTQSRFMLMAKSECYWEEADTDIKEIVKKLRGGIEAGTLSKGEVAEEEWSAILTLIEEPKLFYEKYKEQYDNKKQSLYNLWNKLNQKKVVIVGCGQAGRFFHALLERKFPCSVMAYCDNYCKAEEVQGIAVYRPQQAVQLFSNAMYVIASNKYQQELYLQLSSLNVREDQIIAYTMGIDPELLEF